MDRKKLDVVNEELAKLLRPVLRDDSALKYSSSCYVEARKLETKIQDWAANLGFCLPNGSAPPPNYFSSLTATPHRRQLWEVIVERVQSRKKVENKKKQLLAFNLKNRNKNTACFSSTNFLSQCYFWMKQNELETKINEEEKTSAELERTILAGTSDLLFSGCKLQDLEKRCEEYKEKTLILKLFNKRQKSYLKELETLLLNIKDAYQKISLTKKNNNEILLKNNLSQIEAEIASSEDCENRENSYHDCEIQNKIQNLLDLGETEAVLWEKVLNLKKALLCQFSVFLEELRTSERDLILKKKLALEESLKSSITKLKKDVTLKSLEIMINEADGNILDSEIEKLTANVEALLFKNSPERSLNDNLSYLTAELGDSFSSETEFSSCLKNYLVNVQMKSYHKFLKAELSRLENESLKKKKCKKLDGAEEVLKENSSLTKSICNEINIFTTKHDKQKGEIIQLQNKIQELLRELDCKVKDKDFVKTVEETVDNLKRDSEKQINAFLEIPLEAFKMVENSIDKKSFTCDESLSSSLSAGESKQFSKSMLIPYQEARSILEEIEKRKKIVIDLKKFISEREKLSEAQKEIFSQLTSIPHESKACEKNFKDSETIVLNALRKANELYSAFESVPKILQNWVQQPYRLMISDTEIVGGMTLKEYEKLYENIKSATNS